jgi:cobaltochelatase CobS
MKQSRYEHKDYDKLVLYSKAVSVDGHHMPILLTGPAGTSKSKAAEHLAEDLKLRFGYLPMNQQTTKSDMLGYLSPSGDAVLSLFADFYINGGVFVLEELDAANSNILLALNAAIAGTQGYFAGKMYKKHKDFHLIATANTYGGSNSSYTARTKLDASTLSRFIRLEWNLDEDLETHLVASGEIDKVIKASRNKLKEYGLELSMRDALSFTSLINIGIASEEAAASTLLREIEPEIREYFKELLVIRIAKKEKLELFDGDFQIIDDALANPEPQKTGYASCTRGGSDE